jgi:anti-sigma factor RsiW
MNCNEASELLAAAVLGDLDRDEQRAVHTHLADCERCLEEEQELFQTMHLLRARPDQEPGPDLHRAVMARAGGRGRMTRTLLTAAATVLVVLSLQTVIQNWPAGPAAPVAATVRSPHLLEGTLFDRQRNLPEEVKQFRKTRGDRS